MMALFDSHCHVDEPKFDDDREDVLTRMAEAGITRYAVIGSDMATSRHSADFAAAHPGCYAAIGIHPHEAKGFVEDDLQRLADWSKEEKVVAIGEIGLDYYYDLSPRETQMTVCEAQMDGRPLYFDGDHLSAYGNRVLIPDFERHLGMRTATP